MQTREAFYRIVLVLAVSALAIATFFVGRWILLARELSRSKEEREQLKRELSQLRRDLEEKERSAWNAERLKGEIIANLSHELRTPLNGIIGFSELLLEEGRQSFSAAHLRFIEDVLTSGRQLLALVNDLLEMAQIEARRLELQIEQVAPDAAISNALAVLAWQEKRKDVEIRRSGVVSTAVLADPHQLQQVILKLLSNAVKFSPAGSAVEVGAEAAERGVRFFVRDQGPGIDEALLSRLFEPFVMGDSSAIKEHSGAGVGLALCKRLVEAHGGTVGATSTPGKGSTFWFVIPGVAQAAPWIASALAKSPPPPAGPAGPAGEREGAQKRPLLLLVEDDVITARLVRAFLSDAGYDLLEARNPARAMELARQRQPAAILLDLNLGGEDGLHVLRRLKHEPATAAIPVIIESVRAEENRGLLLGAADYLVKPLDRARLLESVARVLQPSSEAAAPLVLAIDDDPVVATVLRAVLVPSGYRVKTVALGREGLEIARREEPALLIVDLLLPDMSGLAVVEALAEDAVTRTIPAIALTGANLSASDRERLQKRFSSVIQKGDFTRESVLLAVQRAIAAAPEAARPGGPSILIGDDPGTDRDRLRMLLERRGYRVFLAESGDASLELARREQPSLIVLDLAMPGKDGLATARELRLDPAFRRTPLIAVLQLATPGDEERARAAGFDACLTRPIERAALAETVERLLKRAPAETETAR